MKRILKGLIYVPLVLITVLFIPHVQASELGRVMLNNEELTIYADGTWKKSGEECTELKSKIIGVTFCLSPEQWKNSSVTDPYEYEFQLKTDEVYSGLITEKTYVPLRMLRDLIISNAADAQGLGQPEILDEGMLTFAGQTWSYIEMTYKVKDFEAYMKNIYNSKEGVGTVQFAVYGTKSVAEKIKTSAKGVKIYFND